MRTLAALLPLLFLPRPAGDAGSSLERLQAGQAVERSLSGSEMHEYAVALVRGQLLQVVVDQMGVDLVEELYDPGGRLVIRVDTPRGSSGPESLWAIAGTTGTHRLRVRGLDAETSGGYEVRIVAVRPSSADDRTRVEAQRMHLRSRGFEALATESSRRQSRLGLDKAWALWRRLADPEQEGLVELDRVLLSMAQGDGRSAIAAAERGLACARAAADSQLEAKMLNQVGLGREFLGDPAGGIEVLDRAAVMSRGAGDRQGEGGALHLKAWGEWNLGRYQEALELDQRALEIARETCDREAQAWALNGLGLTYWALGDNEKSIRFFEEALGLWNRLGDRRAEAFTLENLGFSYWTLGASRKALEAYERVLPVVRALGDRQAEALVLNNIGLARISLGDPALAAATLGQALSLWRAIGNPHGTAMSLRNLGSAQEGIDLPDEALSSWRASLAAARESGDRRSEATTLASMARLEARRGGLDEARARIEESLSITESLRGQIAAPGFKASFLSSRQDDYAIAMDVLLALDAREPGRGFAVQAFQVSEKARSRALLDAIAEARLDLEAEVPEDLRRREKDLGAEIKRLEAELAAAKTGKAEAEARLGRAEDEWDGLITEMRRRVPRYASLRYPQVVSDAAARRPLDPAAAIVSYSIGADRVLVFVLTASRLFVRRLAVSPADLTERVEDYVGLIARDEGDRWARLGNRLYSDLVAPWRGEISAGVRHVIVIPDGVLASLPFEVLAPAEARGRRLVEDFVLSYAPSVTALGELEAAPAAPATPAAMLVIAGPLQAVRPRSPDGSLAEAAFDLAPLPRATAEARAVARFGGPGTEVLTGPLASERHLREAPLDRFRVIHFATHGLLDAQHPSRSALLLTGEGNADGLLTAREIYRLRLKCDLVVLSACQTARGRILAGEGVQGLAQAFFHAGSRSVVATLWDVNDARAERLMTAFYAHLAGGVSKAEALTAAKRELLAAEPDLAPRYWAPFVLIGDGRGGVLLSRPAWWQALLGR
jgi:CHAT domain-containing protein